MMIKFRESTILIIATIITSIAALFNLIGLITSKWLKLGLGLWNCHNVCSTSTATLTILALLFLVITIILLIFLVFHLFPRSFRIILVVLPFLSTLFLLISTAYYLQRFNIVGYSFELVVTAHAFAFIVSVILAFWFGTTMNESNSTTTTSSSSIIIPMPSLRRN